MSGCENCNLSINNGKHRVGFQPCDYKYFQKSALRYQLWPLFSRLIFNKKCFIFGILVQVKSTFQISDSINMIIFWLYSSSNTLKSHVLYLRNSALLIGETDILSLHTDVVLFFFSFFSKTSASEASAREKARSTRKKIFFFPHYYPLALAVNKSPAVYILSSALDGLRRENRRFVSRLDLLPKGFLLPPLSTSILFICFWIDLVRVLVTTKNASPVAGYTRV